MRYPCSQANLTTSPNWRATPIMKVCCGDSMAGHHTPAQHGVGVGRGRGGAGRGGLLTLAVRRLLAPLALLAAGDLGGAVELEPGLAGEHGQAGHQVLARGTLPSLALVKTISTFVKIFLQILLFLLKYF